MLTFEERNKVNERYDEFKKQNHIDRTKACHLIAWLSMMGLLDEEAVKELLP